MVLRFAVGGAGFLLFMVRSRGWVIRIMDLSAPIERELLNNSGKKWI
jgi:hypothetical protein